MGNSVCSQQDKQAERAVFVRQVRQWIGILFASQHVAATIFDLRESEWEQLHWLVNFLLLRRSGPQEVPRSSGCTIAEFVDEAYGPWKIIARKHDRAQLAYRENDEGDLQIIDYAIPKPRDGFAPSKGDYLVIDWARGHKAR